MKIALIGYGAMGKQIEALSENTDQSVELILDEHNNEDGEGITEESMLDIDVAIDFSHPDAFVTNVDRVLETGTPLVIGTTGWRNRVRDIDERCKENDTPVIFGSNFSLGVQLFAKLLRKAGDLFGGSDLFDSVIHEVHHTRKADAPSGTAYTLAEQFLEGAGSDKNIEFGVPEKGRVNPDENLYVTSQRLGSVFGEHQLRLNSEFDDIEITHRARSRDAFASGALQAARWIVRQKPGFYKIEDVVADVVKE